MATVCIVVGTLAALPYLFILWVGVNTEYRLLLDTRERLGDACSLLTWDDVGVVDGKPVARFNTHPVFTCWFILLALLFVLHGT